MGISLVLFLIVVGFLASFLSAIVTNISQDEFNRIIKDDYKSAQKLQKLELQFENSISPFQIIEVVNYTVAGIIGGNLLFQSNYSFGEMFLFSAIGVVLILIGRYSSQAYGIKLSDRLAHVFTNLSYFIYLITLPIFGIVKVLTETIIGTDDDEDSKDEIAALVDSAREDGSLDNEEYRILKNVINFDNIKVGDVMTPRTVVFSASAEKTVGEMLDLQEIHMYSRFPIWEGESMDDGILGYVMSKDIMLKAIQGKMDIKLSEIVREINTITLDDELDKALEIFLAGRAHQLIVIDQYGGVQGLVTMEDVLETILGAEIVDEADRFVDMRQLAKQKKHGKIHYNVEKIYKNRN